MSLTFDILVIGSGIAGLSFALRVADRYRVAVVTRRRKSRPAPITPRGHRLGARPDDSFDLPHARYAPSPETGSCHADVVEMVVKNGPARVQELTGDGRGVQQGQDPSAPSI